METTVVIELTEDEAEFLRYLVQKESRGLFSDEEALLIKSLLNKLK